ncbi:MAG TPA: YhdP family protein [Gammaproteobacteria bacterium]|jgi:uncharacterized protein (TIGR02099 family)
MGKWQRRLWKWAAGLFAALVILLAAVIGLFRVLTPLVPSYRLQIEQWASTTLRHPVEIHSMGADWSWSGPEATLQDARILSRDRKQLIVAAQEVRLSLDWRALIHGQLPKPSRVVLVGPRLELQHESDGSYLIRGLGPTRQETPTDWRATLDELLSQTAEIVVKDGQLTVYDAGHPAPAVFSRIGFKVDNVPLDHRVEGEVTLPAELGRRIGFELHIQGGGVEFSNWDWHARVTGDGLQAAKLIAYLPPDAQGYLGSGMVDFDAQADSRQGQLQSATLNFDAHNLVPAAPLGSGPAVPLAQGRLNWARELSGWRLQLRDLQMQVGHGTAWNPDDLDLEFAQDPDGEHWSADAAYLRLQDLAALAEWLPKSEESKLLRLRPFAPQGELSKFGLKLHLFGQQLKDWSVKGDFDRLGLRASEGWPGFDGMSGSIDLADTGGQLQLAAEDADVDFRPLFRNLMHADQARLVARVDHDAHGWRVKTDSFQVSNHDGAAHGRVGMQFPADGSAPVLDLDASVDRGDARNKSLYFPVGIMPKPVVVWLDDAIKSGEVTSGSVSIHGKTDRFPWPDNKDGIFDIQFHAKHVELDYFAGWPPLKDMDADVHFLGPSLEAVAHGGTIHNLVIQDGSKARFAQLKDGVLQVDGSGKGAAGDALDIVRQGPVGAILNGDLDDFAARGPVTGEVHFTLPVTHAQDFVLKGRAELQKVDVWPLKLPDLVARQLQGAIDFGNYGVAVDQIQGTLLGGPMTLGIRTPVGHPGKASRLAVHGVADAQGIAGVLGYGSERWLTGSTPWQVDGTIPMQPGTRISDLDLALHSDLQGLAIKLPAPFSKAEAESRPLDAEIKMETDDDLSITGIYQAALGLRVDLLPKDGRADFDRGELRIGGASAQRPVKPGFSVDGYLASFDWAEWKPLLPEVSSGDAQAGAQVERGAVPDVVGDIDLSIGRLSAFGQDLDKVHMALQRAADGWTGNLDSTLVAGNFSVPGTVDAGHPIVLDMDRVQLADNAAGVKPAAMPEPVPAKPIHVDPRSVPALRFTAKQFQFGRMSLDNISLALVPRPDGIAFEDVKVVDPNFTIAGNGTWLITPAGQQHTALNADVESKDVQKSLQSLGFDAGLTGDKGSIVAVLNWDDSPMGDAVQTLGGKIHVTLQDGQIQEVAPGAGRLFGLLSINALPRRLLLNFSDVFSKGFGYDSIDGDFLLQSGDAYTQNLLVKGPAASIHLVGRTGLAKHDFDQALIVDPNVGSSLPVVAGLAAGLVPGAVVFLLTEIFKKPLTKAGEVRYHLTGPWDNPVLTKVPNLAPPATTAPKKP